MEHQIIGLDMGRNGVKAYVASRRLYIPSVVGEWRDRNLCSSRPDDIEAVFQGERYFCGNLAATESEFGRYMMTDNKAHGDTLLLALVAIHLLGCTTVSVVTGLPVKQHQKEDKDDMRRLLKGTHAIEVNGIRKVITIGDVKVGVEGGGAFWSAPKDGLVRVIDAGSKTVNYVTMRDRRYVDRDSGTLPFGFNTNKSDNPKQMAARIAGELGKKWGSTDQVGVSGGRAQELAELLKPYFTHAQPYPDALFANAIGFCRAGGGS